MALTREQILAADDLRRECVEIPEWGDAVYVRVMTGAERARLEALSEGQSPLDNLLTMLVFTLCDARGHLLFTVEDRPALGAKAAQTLYRLYSLALRVNRFTSQDLEELEGNSSASLNGASGSV